MRERIEEGSMVFIADGDEGIGAVRELRPPTAEIVVYIENAGDFVLSASAIRDVHSGKVMLDLDHIGPELREALGHARDAEDPHIAAVASAPGEDDGDDLAFEDEPGRDDATPGSGP